MWKESEQEAAVDVGLQGLRCRGRLPQVVAVNVGL